MKIPVIAYTYADHYIGEVEVDSIKEFEKAADKLWESRGYDWPTLCHQCSDGLELGDFEINNKVAAEYLKDAIEQPNTADSQPCARFNHCIAFRATGCKVCGSCDMAGC